MHVFCQNTPIKRLKKFSKKCFIFFNVFCFLKSVFTWQLLSEKCVFVVEKSQCFQDHQQVILLKYPLHSSGQTSNKNLVCFSLRKIRKTQGNCRNENFYFRTLMCISECDKKESNAFKLGHRECFISMVKQTLNLDAFTQCTAHCTIQN